MVVNPNSPGYIPGYKPGDYNPFISNGLGQEDIWRGMGNRGYEDNANWQAEFGNLANQYGGAESGATDLVNNLYSPIWNGGGGYTPDQMNNILQTQGLQDVQDQLPGNQLTDTEKTQIQGDPYAGFNLFAGQAPAISEIAANSGYNMQNGVNAGRSVGNSIVDQMRSGYGSAIDPSKLTTSSGYRPGLDSALAQGRSDIAAAQGDPGLDVTPDYLRQAGMSDQEVQDAATAAARSVGAQYGATKDQVMQAAAAAGTATPLGLASAMGALDRSSAADQADALNQARLNARQMQRDAAQNVQNTQLSAGQYRAGLGSSNALALQNANLNTQQQAEQTRLGAEQGLADRQMQAVSDVGNAGLNNNNNMTSLGLNAATNAGNMNLNAAQYNADRATQLMQSGEQEASDRAMGLASNRQNINQNNQQTQLGINNTLSNRYVTGYAPWLQQQSEGRQAAQNQQGYFGGQQNQQNQFRLQGQGQANNYLLGAQQGYSGIRQDNKNNSFGSQLKNGIAGGLGNFIGSLGTSAGKQAGTSAGKYFARGGIVDHHQIAQVGEGDRPEMILPLDPQTPASRQNIFERAGSRLGEAMGLRRRPAMGSNSYMQNMGRHMRPSPMPYSEMGTLAYA